MFKRLLASKRRFFGLPAIDWLLILIGLIIFSIITLWTITKFSIWFDEAFGAYLIKFNFLDIARYTAADVHPPLYYWLLKLWSMAFGNSELALRSMSMLFGGIAIVFGYLLTHKLFGEKAARVSLIFMVLSPMLVRYSQEARMYTLMAAIALAATYVLTIAVNTKKKLPWAIYGILIGLGMWTHYLSAIVWIAHWIWRADNIRRTTKKGEFIKKFFSKEWIFAHIIAICVFALWLPFMIYQMAVVEAFGFWIPPVTPDTMLNFMTNVFLYLDVGDITGWLALGFVVAIILIIILAIRVYRSLDVEHKQSYRLIAVLALMPVVVLFVMSMPPLRSSFVDRYLITSAVGIAIFIGVTLAIGIKSMRPKWQAVIIVFMAGLMIIGVTNVWRLGNYNKSTDNSNNTRQIIEAVDDKAVAGQPIIAATPWFFYEADFYSTNNNPIYYIAPSEYKFGSLEMLKDNDNGKIKDMPTFTQKHSVIWYVGYPGSNDFSAPNSEKWTVLQTVTVNDSVNGKAAYKAIQYKINNN